MDIKDFSFSDWFNACSKIIGNDDEKPIEYNKIKKYEDIGNGLCNICRFNFPLYKSLVLSISTPNRDKIAHYIYCPKCSEIIEITIE